MTTLAADESQDSLEDLVLSIERETGLCFPEVHHDTILKAARLHCRQLGLAPDCYASILQTDSEEKARFLDDIMIGETYFFRDEKQFAALASFVLPQLFREVLRLRIWSVTCATGEEALSLLALLEEVKATLGSAGSWTLLASDINRNALEALRRGVYSLSSFRTDGRRWHDLLRRLGERQEGVWVLRPGVLDQVTIQHVNVLSGQLPAAASMDLIFFRNTLVYMKQEQKDCIVGRLVGTLRPGGFLFLASPEVPTVRHAELEVLERDGAFFYRKRTAAAPAVAKPATSRVGPRQPPAGSAPGPGTVAASVQPASQSASRPARLRVPGTRQLSQAELRSALQLASEGQPAAPAGSEPVQAVAALVVRIVAAIQENRFGYALQQLGELEKAAGDNFLNHYLIGLVFKHQGRLTEALDRWERARLYESGFWPATFQAGATLAASGNDRGADLLRECLAAIDGRQHGSRYRILLDGFDISYYRHMALRMLEKFAL